MSARITARVAPNYSGGGLVNLMASVAAAFGGEPSVPELDLLPGAALATKRNVVLLLVDGLGYQFLAQRPGSFLFRNTRGAITSVFPSTTASAISSVVSGLPPAQHGMVGWFVFIKALGAVVTVLPFRPRVGGQPYGRSGVDPRAVFDWPPLFDRLGARSYVVTRADIANSEFSIATAGGAQRRGYESFDECLQRIGEVISAPGEGRQYVYAYWPMLDTLSHQHGSNSQAVIDHFEQIDRQLASFADAMIDSDTALVVCADHGFVDTAPGRTVMLGDHPRLAQCLGLPLTGEPRVAYCYVRSRHERLFEDYVRGELAHACTLNKSAELVFDAGYFGPGTPHRDLLERVGDYTLIMNDGYIVKDQLLGEKPFVQVGVHGGLTAAEMYVPLVSVGLDH